MNIKAKATKSAFSLAQKVGKLAVDKLQKSKSDVVSVERLNKLSGVSFQWMRLKDNRLERYLAASKKHDYYIVHSPELDLPFVVTQELRGSGDLKAHEQFKTLETAIDYCEKLLSIESNGAFPYSEDKNAVGVKRLNDGSFKLHWVRLRDDNPYRYHGQGGKLKYQITYSGFCEPPFFAHQLDKKGKELSCAEFDTLEKAAAHCDKLRLKEK